MMTTNWPTEPTPPWPAVRRGPATLPSDVVGDLGFFDRFAQRASDTASRAPFFAGCVVLVGLWLVQGVVVMAISGDLSTFLDDRFQLEINTTTTIITFLMVALLQNAGTRSDLATQHKLNAIADGLVDLMEHMALAAPANEDARRDLEKDILELREAVGLELRESTTPPPGARRHVPGLRGEGPGHGHR